MTGIKKAVCWATVMIVMACAGRFGVMDNGSATTLFIVLPIVAWTALSGRGCRPLWRKA